MKIALILSLSIATVAHAQEEEELPDELQPTADALGLPAPSPYAASSWDALPGGPDGVNDPVVTG